MSETRYFIINHEAAFADCRLSNAHWDGAIRPIDAKKAARLMMGAFDSAEKGNRWQRVLADITISDGARIIWRVYASDSENTLGMGGVYVIENADDFLLPGVQGRFAALEAEFYGEVEIRSIQVYASWESFLDYLPEIYRNHDFSDRFLRIFASQYLDMELRINAMPGFLDPASAPEESLRWLAEIAGVPHVSLWETEGLRGLLKSCVYKRRGQFSVFAEYIEYFTGYKPYIAEHFRFVMGQPQNDRMYSGGDVTVFLPPEATGVNMEALDTVIADFLPGDVVWRVIPLHPNTVVSGYTYLGINTRVGAYEGAVVGKSRIGFSVVGGIG